MKNTVLLIDVLSSALNVALRMQETLQRASLEGRDVSDEELELLRRQTGQLRAEWDAENEQLN